jgi:hypothetical protein
VNTFAECAAPVVCVLPLVFLFLYELLHKPQPRPEPQEPGPNEWIDARLATETHDGRRMALRMIRDRSYLENP